MQFKVKAKSIDTKNFLTIKSGETVNVVFQGDPYDFRHHWETATGPSLCTGNDCPKCKVGDKSKFRFRINAIVSSNGVYTPKVFEQGWKMYQNLEAIHSAGVDLEKTVVAITRHGETKNDTTYIMIPKTNVSLTETQLAAIKAVKLFDLPNLDLAVKESKMDEAPHTLEDVPFQRLYE